MNFSPQARPSRSSVRRRFAQPLLALLSAAVLAQPGVTAWAQTYLIDFGGSIQTTYGPAPDDPLNYWNNLTDTIGTFANGTLANLVSSQNITSTISVVIIKPFNGVNPDGTQVSSLYPVNATRDSLYGNTEEWAGKANIFPEFKLTGLDPATKYTLTFYASRQNVTDVREVGYTVTGGNSGFVALDAANNVDQTAAVADITPDGSGEIKIALAPTANNNNGYHFTYLNTLRVDAAPPQTALAFTQQPASHKVQQGKPVTLTAGVSGSPPYFIRWFENGMLLPDATQFSYTIPAAQLSMNGYQYSVTVSNLAYAITSSNAVLTVLNDTNPPSVVKAASYDGLNIQIVFDEALDFSSGADANNYTLQAPSGSQIWSALLSPDSKRVTLQLTQPITGSFTVAMNHVMDEVGNTVAPNTLITGPVIAIEDQDLLFDFGGGSTTQFGPAPNDPVNYWNNVTSAGTTDGGQMVGLVTVYNTETGIGFSTVRRFNGVNDNGTQASPLFPANATRDSLFGNTGTFGGIANIFPKFNLTGLNPARQYTLTFFASRTGVSDNRTTGYTVEGANSGFAALNAANNVSNTTNVAGIFPTAAGEIAVSMAPTAANNNSPTYFTYLGVLRLSPYTAPLKFTSSKIVNGKIELQWSGNGKLERSSSPAGGWAEITPAPTSPYQESLTPGENRFYRLKGNR